MTNVDPKRPESAGWTGRLERRAVATAKQFLVLFLYLWILFGLFVLNERIILRQHGIDFVAHGMAVFNTFILAKVVLVAEHLNFSRWLNRRPLIYPILHDSFVFSVMFIVFHLLEEEIVGLVRGKGSPESISGIGGGGIGGIVCVAVIFFFTLIPFFSFRNFSRAIGPDRMNEILFGTRFGRRADATD